MIILYLLQFGRLLLRGSKIAALKIPANVIIRPNYSPLGHYFVRKESGFVLSSVNQSMFGEPSLTATVSFAMRVLVGLSLHYR